jgi:hypothetical protein
MTMRTLALAVAALLAGCTTPIRGLDHDPSFNPISIDASGLAVGGVVSARRPLDPGRRASYADLLRSALRSQRPNLTILTADAVVSALGEDDYQEMLRQYRELGAPSAATLRLLSKRLEHARYLVLARIDRNDTSRWTTDEAIDNSKGKRIGTKTHYRHGRTVGVSLRILDLDGGATVWSGSVEKSSWNENTEDDRDPDLDDDHKHQSVGKDLRDAALAGLALGALEAVLGDDGTSSQSPPPDLYPDPPDGSDLLEQAFRGFGENLPQR